MNVDDIAKSAEVLRDAKHIVMLTGAGVSAESGVPTFRDKDGLWDKYDVTTLATPQAFEEDPAFVWQWYDWRRQKVKEVKPNPGHHAIAVRLWGTGPDDISVRELLECPLAECPPKDDAGKLLRPHVVWFGETLSPAVIEGAQHAAMDCDVMFVVGTANVVYPSAVMPYAVLRKGGTVIEINPGVTELSSDATISMREKSGEALPEIYSRITENA